MINNHDDDDDDRRLTPASDRQLMKHGGLVSRGLDLVKEIDAAETTPAHSGIYVYCIVEAGEPIRVAGIGLPLDADSARDEADAELVERTGSMNVPIDEKGRSDVYSISHGTLAAVVSDLRLSGDLFGSPRNVLDSTRENVLAHERVNETVMHEHTVIPMSFGTIFKTREDIVELLRSAAEAFGDVLNKMQNKLEFGLKVLWDRDQAIRDVEREVLTWTDYDSMIQAQLETRAEFYRFEIEQALRDVSVASRLNQPIGDNMIMNAAFLISRDQESAFDAKVKAIAGRFDKLTFKYTGPWPPYNFVNIRLKLERA